MKRVIAPLLAVILMGTFEGCSAKQIKENVDNVTNDIRDFGEKATEEH